MQVFATTEGHDVEVVCSLARLDTASQAAITEVANEMDKPVTITQAHVGLTGAVLAWNEAAQAARGDIFVMIGDDTVCQPGWLTNALECLRGDGVIGLNDMTRQDGVRFATHLLVTREYCCRFNGGVLLSPCYIHYYCDVELCERAARLERYVFASDAKIEHQHHMAGKSKLDGVYQWAMQYYPLDEALYYERRDAGFPNDYPEMLRGDS